MISLAKGTRTYKNDMQLLFLEPQFRFYMLELYFFLSTLNVANVCLRPAKKKVDYGYSRPLYEVFDQFKILPDASIIASFDHIPEFLFISTSRYQLVTDRLVPLEPRTAHFPLPKWFPHYSIFIRR